jgi:hypothetical protein
MWVEIEEKSANRQKGDREVKVYQKSSYYHPDQKECERACQACQVIRQRKSLDKMS